MAHHRKNPALVAQVQVVLALHLLLVHHRHIKIGMAKHERAVEVRRCYAEDGKRILVDVDRAAHYAWIIMKMGVPVRITQHDVRRAVGAMLIASVEEMAKMRLNLQCVEIIPADDIDPGARWTVTGVQPYLSYVVRHQILETAVAVAQIDIVWIRLPPILVPAALNLIKAIRLRHIQRMQ